MNASPLLAAICILLLVSVSDERTSEWDDVLDDWFLPFENRISEGLVNETFAAMVACHIIIQVIGGRMYIYDPYSWCMCSRSAWVPSAHYIQSRCKAVTSLMNATIPFLPKQDFEIVFSLDDHPQVSTMTIPELKGNVSTNATNILQFDFVMTYSSLEHSGMGRYGDAVAYECTKWSNEAATLLFSTALSCGGGYWSNNALAQFADLEWIERIKCLLKPGGFLYFGAPMSDVDCLVWNAHRIYGPARLEALQHGFHRRLQIGRKGTGASFSHNRSLCFKSRT